MSYDEVAAKFLDCAAFAKWPAAKAKAIIAAVRRFWRASGCTGAGRAFVLTLVSFLVEN